MKLATIKNGVIYYPLEMTVKQLSALKKNDPKLFDRISEIREKNKIIKKTQTEN